jgi:hypothetical protein
VSTTSDHDETKAPGSAYEAPKDSASLLILSRSTRQFAVPLDGDGGNIRILVSALHVHQRCQVEMFTLKMKAGVD